MKLADALQKVIQYKVYLLAFAVLAVSMITYKITLPLGHWSARIIHVAAGGLIPASLVGLIWKFFVHKDFVNSMDHKLDPPLKRVEDSVATGLKKVQSSISARLTKGLASIPGEVSDRHRHLRDEIVRILHLRMLLDEYAIKGAFDSRDKIDLAKHVRTAKSRIWILVTSFSYLIDRESGARMEEAIFEKARQGSVEVRILGLAPNTESARLRSAFSRTYKNLNQEIPDRMKDLQDKFGDGNGLRVDIRLYDRIPTCGCFFFDSELFFCPLLASTRGRNGVHLQVSARNTSGERSKLFQEFEQDFDKLFRGAKPWLLGNIHPQTDSNGSTESV